MLSSVINGASLGRAYMILIALADEEEKENASLADSLATGASEAKRQSAEPTSKVDFTPMAGQGQVRGES